VINQARLSFLIVCVLCLILSFLLVRWMYRERLSSKDDLLATYREKLALSPTDKTRYSGLRNSALRAEALGLAKKIRQTLPPPFEPDSMNQMLTEQREIAAAKTDEERERIWLKRRDEGINRSMQRMNQVIETYNQEFKAEAILLRDEMLLRLPPEQRSKFQQRNLKEEHAMNTHMVEQVAGRLEQMAKSLPG
jgi:hypothetical protein